MFITRHKTELSWHTSLFNLLQSIMRRKGQFSKKKWRHTFFLSYLSVGRLEGPGEGGDGGVLIWEKCTRVFQKMYFLMFIIVSKR